MPDYNDNPVSRVDNPHHVEGLVSVSDRVARRKEEQKRKKQEKKKKNAVRQMPDELNDSDSEGDVDAQDGHIDFRA